MKSPSDWPSSNDAKNQLEDVMWSLADRLHTRWITKYSKEDYKDAVNFLEVFSLYCICSGIVSNRTHESLLLPEKGDEFLFHDKTITKALTELEHFNSLSKRAGAGKGLSKPLFKRLKKHIDRMFIEQLGFTEQKALVKSKDKALSILKYFKS